MAVKDITRRIIDDAEKEADRIAKEAQNESDRIISEAKEEGKQKHAHFRQQVDKELGLKRGKELVTARLKAKNIILSEKRNLINEVFDNAHKKLIGINKDTYSKFLLSIIKSNAEGGEEIIFPESAIETGKKIVEQAVSDGVEISLSEEQGTIKDGFKFKKGKIEVDFSLDSIISTLREQKEQEAVKALFKHGNS